MSGDINNFTFLPKNHYIIVGEQQGRVRIPSDGNEQVRILDYFRRISLLDIIGKSGTPDLRAFEIKPNATNTDYTIGIGRYYLDGILCENDPMSANQTECERNNQLDLPADNSSFTANTDYHVYLDVWERHLTAVDNEKIKESALEGPDTTTRTKIVWQVKHHKLSPSTNCLHALEQLDLIPTFRGTMAAQAIHVNNNDPCDLRIKKNYTGLQNYFYRIEIHNSGSLVGPNRATIKWSRNNASDIAKVREINGSILTVDTVGMSDLRGFRIGQWMEIIDDEHELLGKPGILVKTTDVKDNKITVDLAGISPITLGSNTKVRIWDMGGNSGPIPISNSWIDIEEGIQVKFSGEYFKAPEFWNIAARTIKGDIEWSRDENNNPIQQPPAGIEHHYCSLAILHCDNSQKITLVEDCRKIFPSLTDLTLRYFVSGADQEGSPNKQVPFPLVVGVSRGTKPVPGIKIKFSIYDVSDSISGTLSKIVSSDTLTPNNKELRAITSTDGLAQCNWILGSKGKQQVIANMVDDDGTSLQVPIIFNATIDPALCYFVSGADQEGSPNKQVPFPLVVGVSRGTKPVPGIKIKFSTNDAFYPDSGTLDKAIPGDVLISNKELHAITDINGLAQCNWILGSRDKQQVIANMVDDDGTSLQVPIIFNATLEDLTKLQGNCTIVVRTDDDINSLIESNEILMKNGGKICFTAGVYNLTKPIRLDRYNNILIEGTGTATKIKIDGYENAFEFNNCNSIHIEKIYVQSTSHNQSKTVSINGVMSFKDCNDIKVIDSTFSCNQRYSKAQACLSFYGETNPMSQIEIKNCNFQVGSMQIGILLKKVNNVIIKDNFIDYVSSIPIPTLKIKKSTLFRNNSPYWNLTHIISKNAEAGVSLKNVSDSNNNLVESIKKILASPATGTSDESKTALQNIIKSQQKLSESTRNTIDLYSVGKHPETASILQSVLETYGIVEQLMEQAVNFYSEKNTSKDSPLVSVIEILAKSGSLLNAAMSSAKVSQKLNAKDEFFMNRNMVYSAILNDTKNFKFTADAIKTIKTIQQDLAMGFQGIVCGGDSGENIQICNNTIKNMIQGIHIGANGKDMKKTRAEDMSYKRTIYFMKEISICENKIELLIPTWYSRQKHGIFVGNTNIAYVKDNIVNIKEINNTKMKQISNSVTQGIKIYGHHGQMILISGNSVSNAHDGILFLNYGTLSPYAYTECLWVMRQNVVYHSDVPYNHHSPSNNIRFLQRDNVPEFTANVITTIRPLLTEGVLRANAGNIDSATKIFTEILKKEPDNVAANYNMGLLLAKTGNTDEALSHFDKVLQIEPDNTEATFNKGLVLANAGNLTEATKSLDQVLVKQPDNPVVIQEKANLLTKLGNATEATKLLDTLQKIDPSKTVDAKRNFLKLRIDTTPSDPAIG